MSVKFGSWIPASILQLQNTTWTALRQGQGTIVRPNTSASTTDWVHFPIPTPTRFNGSETKAAFAMLQFKTKGKASIQSLAAFNGGTLIFDTKKDKTWSGDQFVKEPIQPPAADNLGVGLSALVKFEANDTAGEIEFIGAGIDFV